MKHYCKQYFYGYGFLNWIDPTEYYSGNYSYYETYADSDGEVYDIVVNNETQKIYFTTI